MKKISVGILGLALSMILTGCGVGGSSAPAPSSSSPAPSETSQSEDKSVGADKPVNLTWAAGGMGGGWYSMAAGISSIIKEKNPNVNIKVIPGGSLQNIPFLDNGEAQIAWEQPPFVLAGVKGEDPFKQKSPDLVAIGNGFSNNYFHFIVPAESNIQTSDDIFKPGQKVKVALTPVNNTDEWVFRKILEYYKTSYDQMKKEGSAFFHGSYTEQAEQFKNQNVNVMFSQLALPGSAVTDASVSRDLRVVPMSDGLIQHLSQYALGTAIIPAGTYPNAKNGNEDIKTATMNTILVTNKNVPDDVVYEITKTINESLERLPSIHASLKDYKLEEAVENLGTTLHPGAEKYYKEKGIIK
ncbi:TAXI family TRAP transporter solute-binding subunit [Ammoniphilus sp. 3BR4]|uniref:TAXI family TRAP transporter solute-binding subunit n=1 Tax=Ammoniphilus sp. 3BR4 TaxID=3158265 RepID=UPI003466BFBE